MSKNSTSIGSITVLVSVVLSLLATGSCSSSDGTQVRPTTDAWITVERAATAENDKHQMRLKLIIKRDGDYSYRLTTDFKESDSEEIDLSEDDDSTQNGELPFEDLSLPSNGCVATSGYRLKGEFSGQGFEELKTQARRENYSEFRDTDIELQDANLCSRNADHYRIVIWGDQESYDGDKLRLSTRYNEASDPTKTLLDTLNQLMTTAHNEGEPRSSESATEQNQLNLNVPPNK